VKVIILNPLSVNATDRGEQMAITEKIRQQIAEILAPSPLAAVA